MDYVIENVKPSVVVITPTIGKPQLKRAIESVSDQSYKNILHLIVTDGNEYWGDVLKHTQIKNQGSNIVLCSTPFNTGGSGFYGHRIYAAYPHLVNEDYVAFLDEDNWFEPNHIASLVEIAQTQKLDFAHSLRKVYIEGKYLADDCCESIGRWPIAWTPEKQPDYLVDTSSYLFNRKWLINFCQLWHYGWGGDRMFFKVVKEIGGYNTTGLHTLNYELPDMNKAYGGQLDIFDKYNTITKEKYGGKYPWEKT